MQRYIPDFISLFKNYFLFQDESGDLEGKFSTNWNKKPSEKFVESEKSQLSENRLNIKNYRKYDNQNNENEEVKRRRLSDSVGREDQQLKNNQLLHDQIKFTEGNLNNNNPSPHSNIINDDNPTPSSGLTFRPWGSQRNDREDDRISYSFASNTPNSHAQSLKGNF